MTGAKTVQNLDTNIDLDVYNSKGESLYSKSHQFILPDAEAYRNGLHYLQERSPLYKK